MVRSRKVNVNVNGEKRNNLKRLEDVNKKGRVLDEARRRRGENKNENENENDEKTSIRDGV